MIIGSMTIAEIMAVIWSLVTVATRDRTYLLGTALCLCAEIAQHFACYRVLIRHLLRRERK